MVWVVIVGREIEGIIESFLGFDVRVEVGVEVGVNVVVGVGGEVFGVG